MPAGSQSPNSTWIGRVWVRLMDCNGRAFIGWAARLRLRLGPSFVPLDRLGSHGPRHRAVAQQRQVERVAGFVGQRRFARCAIAVARCSAARTAPRGQLIEDVQQVLLAALVGAAVALDQTAAQRDLVAQPPIAARAAPRRRASARSRPARRQNGGRGGAATWLASSAQRQCRARCACRACSGRAQGALPRAARRRSQRISERARRGGSRPANSGTPGLKWS